MQYPRLTRTLRLVLVCLTLAVGAPLPALVLPSLVPVAGVLAVAPPAAAQTSGGYRRPGGGGYSGGGGMGGFERRPSIGGGYGRPSASSGGFGGAFGGGDLAISRRASSQA